MILNDIRRRAAADQQHILLPEGEDARVVEAAAISARDGIARVTLLGREDVIRELAASSGANLNGVDILDHRKADDRGRIATLYYDLRRAKGTTLEESEQIVKDPLYFANLLVREGRAHTTLRASAGAA